MYIKCFDRHVERQKVSETFYNTTFWTCLEHFSHDVGICLIHWHWKAHCACMLSWHGTLVLFLVRVKISAMKKASLSFLLSLILGCSRIPKPQLLHSSFKKNHIILTVLLFFLQTQNRMKLMADNYEDDHLKTAPDQTNHKPSPDQVA